MVKAITFITVIKIKIIIASILIKTIMITGSIYQQICVNSQDARVRRLVNAAPDLVSRKEQRERNLAPARPSLPQPTDKASPRTPSPGSPFNEPRGRVSRKRSGRLHTICQYKLLPSMRGMRHRVNKPIEGVRNGAIGEIWKYPWRDRSPMCRATH